MSEPITPTLPESSIEDDIATIEAEKIGAPPQNSIGKFIHNVAYNATGSPFFWVVFLGLLSTYPIVRGLTQKAVTPPKVYGVVPEFTFTNELGVPFGTKDLKGKVWVANFIFTSCSSACPNLTKKMLKIRMKVRNIKWLVHLVSFSVDPTHDTPERLKEYAIEHHYDQKVWSFLTGPLEQIDKVVIDGFKMAVERPPEDEPTLFEITHGERFILVDQKGQIRGYYTADDIGLKKLMMDLSLVTNHY